MKSIQDRRAGVLDFPQAVPAIVSGAAQTSAIQQFAKRIQDSFPVASQLLFHWRNLPMADGNKTGKSKLPLLVVAVFVIGAAAGGTVLMRQKKSAAPQPKEQAPKSVLHLQEFLVNLNDSDTAYLRIAIDLGTAEPIASDEKAAAGTVPVIRDCIVEILSAHSSQDLLGADGKSKLRDQILAALNRRLPSVKVQEVYITDFLVQR